MWGYKIIQFRGRVDGIKCSLKINVSTRSLNTITFMCFNYSYGRTSYETVMVFTYKKELLSKHCCCSVVTKVCELTKQGSQVMGSKSWMG